MKRWRVRCSPDARYSARHAGDGARRWAQSVCRLMCGAVYRFRHARPRGICRGAPRRQHQHRSRRPIRNMGRNRARSHTSHRHHRDAWPGERIGRSSRAHRLRSHRRISRERIAEPRIAAGSRRLHRACQRAVRCGTASPPTSLRWPSTSGRRASMRRITSTAAWPVPLSRLKDNLKTLPKDRPLLVYCAGGYRSSIAASLLQRAADLIPWQRSPAASPHGKQPACPCEPLKPTPPTWVPHPSEARVGYHPCSPMCPVIPTEAARPHSGGICFPTQPHPKATRIHNHSRFESTPQTRSKNCQIAPANSLPWK